MSAAPKIYAAMIAIAKDVPAVPKGRDNKQQGYKFRGIDDVYLALHDIFAKHGVFSVPEVLEEKSEERTSRGGSALIYRILKIKYTFYADDGSSVSAIVIGEGQDSGDKASNKAMSVAHKYAILQVFSIPTDEKKDPEEDSQDLEPKVTNKAVKREYPRQQPPRQQQQQRPSAPAPAATVVNIVPNPEPKFTVNNDQQFHKLLHAMSAIPMTPEQQNAVVVAMEGLPFTKENVQQAIRHVRETMQTSTQEGGA